MRPTVVHSQSLSRGAGPGRGILGPEGVLSAACLLAAVVATAPGCAADDDGADSDGAEASEGEDADGSGDESGSGADPRLAVTADFQAGTLSLLDLDALAAGATAREDVLVGEIDLSMYSPGPLQVELTPDGGTAVVTISPGFFGGVVGSLSGFTDVDEAGTLLIVDLATRSVSAELSPMHVPMGIAITPDGTTAFTANYGTGDQVGTTMTVVDLAGPSIVEDIEVGPRPEQVDLSSDGALGLLNIATDGTVIAFETSDPAGTLSTPLLLSDDPSDVAFIPGTSRAVVANSVQPSSYAIIDVSDPAAPTLVEDAPPPGGVPYGTTPIAGTTEFLLTVTDFNLVRFLRIDAAGDPSEIRWMVDVDPAVAFPLGIAVDGVNEIAIAGVPGGDPQLAVVNLDGSGVMTLPWPASGPTYVALQP